MPDRLNLTGLVQPSRRPPPGDANGLDFTGLIEPAADQPEAEASSFLTLLSRLVPTGLRVGGAIVGGVGGSALGPGGTIGGGALGAGIGETLAELYEQHAGQRRALNPVQIATQTALGAVPIVGRAAGPVRTMLLRGAQGAGLASAGTIATQLAETGELPAARDVVLSAGAGTVLGGAGGAAEARALRRPRAARFPAARATTGEVPPISEAAAPRTLSSSDMAAEALDLTRGAIGRPVEPAPVQPARAVFAPREGAELPVAKGLRPIGKPLEGFDAFLSKFPQPVREGVRDVLEQNGGYVAQRRGVQPQARTEALARQMAVDVSQTVAPGTAFNAETLRGYANAAATIGAKVQYYARKVTTGTATDADLLALAAAKAEHGTVVASLVGARTEAGRALASFRMFSSILDTHNVRLIGEAANAPGFRQSAQQLAAALADLPDDLSRYDFLKRQAKPSMSEYMRSYYYANILSGQKTQERNILGNAFNLMAKLAVHPVAAGLDVARSAVRGTPREVYLGELPHQVVGAVVGASRGFQEFAFVLKYGLSRETLTKQIGVALEAGKFDAPRVELPGGGLNPLNVPGRLLDAADVFFRSVARNQELYGGAYAVAKREGKRGAALLDRMAELRVSPDDPIAQQLQQQATRYATRAVFQEQPGAFSQWLLRGKQRFPVLTFVIPFVKTPANIFRQGMEFSPAGFAMKATRAGGREGTQAQARAAVGSLLVAPLAWLAATGKLSGDGPRDPAERAALMESGWRPNAVKVGDSWVSFQLFQPVSVPASIVANAFEAWREEGSRDDRAQTIAAMTVFRTMRSTLDQSYLSGLFDFLQAIDEPSRSASTVVGRTIGGLVPLSGLQRNIATATDATVRQPDTIAESLKTGVPGISTSVQPRLDRSGQPVRRPGGFLRRLADPFNVSPVVRDAVADELTRLGVRLSLPSKAITVERERVQLPGDQALTLRQARGQAVRQALEALLGDPGYAELTDDDRRELLEDAITKARRGVSRRARGVLRAQEVLQLGDLVTPGNLP